MPERKPTRTADLDYFYGQSSELFSFYTRSITGLYRVLRRRGQMAAKLPNPKYIPKPYEKMHFPGERVQVDMKFVPQVCIVREAKGEKFYQYTAIDEFSRWRYLEAFREHSSYSSATFVEHLIKAAPFKIQCIQTDNGAEFTKKFVSDDANPHLFGEKLKEFGIRHKLIKPFTPRHNGKSSVPIAKITNTSMHRINSIRSLISKSSLLFTAEDTIAFPFDLWAGLIL